VCRSYQVRVGRLQGGVGDEKGVVGGLEGVEAGQEGEADFCRDFDRD
jgi:hypothetical protein